MAFDKKVIYQYYAGICANIISISYGAFCGWPSASFLELQANDSPLDTGPMTNKEAGYVGSMLCVGGLFGSLFFTWYADRVGRKLCLLITAIPSLLAWGIIVIARNPFHLYISRFLGGFSGGGVFSVIPLYITEFSEIRIRGVLGSFIILSNNLGILFAFILGNFYSYVTVALILSLLTVLFLVLFLFLPESPQYLIRQNKMEEAEKALRYFHNVGDMMSQPSEKLKGELERMLIDDLPSNIEDYSISLSDINNRTTCKALIIGIVLLLLNQFCGCFALISYTATIFQQAGSSLSPNMAAIVVGFIQLLGSYVAIVLVERAGRKILLVSSAIGTGIGLTFLGGYSYLKAHGYDTTSLNWVSVTSFSFVMFISSVGILTLPYMVITEIMPPRIRYIGTMFCMSILWIFAFFILTYFPVLSEILGIHNMMFIFAANCFAGTIFLIIYLPETKGKSIEDILAML